MNRMLAERVRSDWLSSAGVPPSWDLADLACHIGAKKWLLFLDRSRVTPLCRRPQRSRNAHAHMTTRSDLSVARAPGVHVPRGPCSCELEAPPRDVTAPDVAAQGVGPS